MTKPGRIPCVVPFWRRTANEAKYPPGTEIICGKHWRMAPATWRRRRSKLERIYSRRFGDSPFWEFPAGTPKRIEAVRLDRLINALWERCKTEAIERAAGI
jgi:hypothetical protein